MGKNCGFNNSSGSSTLEEFNKISTSSDLNPFFCFTPAAKGFITPTSMSIFRKVIANPAVMYVFPTSVSVPVMKIDFMFF